MFSFFSAPARFFAVVIVLVSFSAAMAQQAPEGPSLYMDDDRGTLTLATPDAFLERAQERGRIRVIVGVDAEFTPDGHLNAEVAARQSAGIAASQSRLMGALESPVDAHLFEAIPYVAMSVTPADLSRVLTAPGVISVHEDVYERTHLAESVPLVEANLMWRRGFKGDGAVIAVLDTGTQVDHVAFQGPDGPKIIRSACFSLNSDDSKSLCPSGKNKEINIQNGEAAPDCKNSIDACGHGTHVASIAAGFHKETRGVAQRADIISVQVFTRVDSPEICEANKLTAPCALTTVKDQMRGLEQVLEWHKAGVPVAAINMSLGSGAFTAHCDGDPRKTSIDKLLAAGVATIISSGNGSVDGGVSRPACISTAVTVGNTTQMDKIARRSNHDQIIDLLAPGTKIYAAKASSDSTTARGTRSGTSYAAPHVAGAFALLKTAVPDATPDEIERALKCTGKQIARDDTPKPRILIKEAYDFLKKPDQRKNVFFKRAKDVDQWTHIKGDWTHNGNSMRVFAVPPVNFIDNQYYLSLAPFCANDMRVTAEMKGARGAIPGIVLSATASEDEKFSGLFFSYREVGADTTRVVIQQIESLDLNSGAIVTSGLCIETVDDDPRVGKRRTLEAQKVGNELKFSIDGKTVCKAATGAVTDARFTDGHAGVLMLHSAREPNAEGLEVFSVRLKALSQSTTMSEAIRIGSAGDSAVVGAALEGDPN